MTLRTAVPESRPGAGTGEVEQDLILTPEARFDTRLPDGLTIRPEFARVTYTYRAGGWQVRGFELTGRIVTPDGVLDGYRSHDWPFRRALEGRLPAWAQVLTDRHRPVGTLETPVPGAAVGGADEAAVGPPTGRERALIHARVRLYSNLVAARTAVNAAGGALATLTGPLDDEAYDDTQTAPSLRYQLRAAHEALAAFAAMNPADMDGEVA